MAYAFLGGLGFLIGCALELAPVQRAPGAKPLLWLAVAGLILSSLAMMALHGDRFVLPTWTTGVGWGLLLLVSILMLYSMLLELPFRRTFVNPGPGPHLVTTGTYALVRHPTVLWFTLILVSLLLLSRSQSLLMALPLWVALDVMWVFVQERVSLAQAFPHYHRYQQVTPMLIPNLGSLRACLATLRIPKGGEAG